MGSSHATHHEPGGRVARQGVAVERERGRAGRSISVSGPAAKVPQRRPQRVGHGTIVDRHAQRRVRVGAGKRQRSAAATRQQVAIGVGGAGQLPRPEAVAVGLPRGDEARHVALRLHLEHRLPQVGANPRRSRCPHRGPVLGVLRQRGGPAAAAVDEERVVDLRQRVDGIHVGHHPSRRLRLADGDEPSDAAGQATERRELRGRLHRPPGLRVDVVRKGIAGMDKSGVPLGVLGLQSALSVDSDPLRPDPDIGVTAAKQLQMQRREVRIGLGLPRHVEPLHDDHAVEAGGVGRVARQHPDRVGRCLAGRRRPDPVGPPVAALAIRLRVAADEELGLDVVVLAHQRCRARRHRAHVRRSRNGRWLGRRHRGDRGRRRRQEQRHGGESRPDAEQGWPNVSLAHLHTSISRGRGGAVLRRRLPGGRRHQEEEDGAARYTTPSPHWRSAR